MFPRRFFIFVYAIGVASIFPAVGFANVVLEWDTVTSQQTKEGFRKTTLSGKTVPGSMVQVQMENIIVLSLTVEQPKPIDFPILYTEFLQIMRNEQKAKGFKYKTVLVDCDLKKAPNAKSPKRGSVSKGKTIKTKEHNRAWVKVFAKKRVLFLQTSCLTDAGELEAPIVNSETDAGGKFILSMELPFGLFQIPAEVVVNDQRNSFLAFVEVNEEGAQIKENADAKDDKKSASEPEAPRAYRIQVWANVGYNRYTYDQAASEGKFNFDNTALAYGPEVHFTIKNLGFILSYRSSEGNVEASDPFVLDKTRYTLQTWRALATYNFSNSKWQARLGGEHRTGPYVEANNLPNVNVYTHRMTSAVAGAHYEFNAKSEISYSAEAHVMIPLAQSTAVADKKSGPGSGFNAAVTALYRLNSRLSVGAAIEADYIKHSFEDYNRTVIDAVFNLKMGVEF